MSQDTKVIDCASENILQNPGFMLDGNGVTEGWIAEQHIGEDSFTTEVMDGTLTIAKIATQPWFIYRQIFDDLGQFSQKNVTFSADLKLNLNGEDVGHAFKVGGGLMVKVLGDPDFLGNEKILYLSMFENEPSLGDTDWMPASVEFLMPEKATRLIVGFVHQANGEMSVRNPHLGVCDKK